jgi:hypothetical protein
MADALTPDGMLLFQFGETFLETTYTDALNMENNLFCDQKGQVYLMYWYKPIILKYSAKGKLLQEIELKYPVLKEYWEHNKKFYMSKEKRLRFKNCALDIWVEDEKIFIINNFICIIEIIEFDMTGAVKNVFYTDVFPDGYILRDFLIRKEKGKYLFYVAKVYPEPAIDVFTY